MTKQDQTGMAGLSAEQIVSRMTVDDIKSAIAHLRITQKPWGKMSDVEREIIKQNNYIDGQARRI